MNEELKIIISAITGEAEKGIKSVNKGLKDMGGASKGASTKLGAAMKGIGVAVGVAAAAVTAAVAAIGGALLAAEKSTRKYREEQAKLNAAFMSVGGSAQAAATAYNGLYRFLGESDRAAEAAAHLARLTTNEQELAEWTKICQGIYATFGDSLPIEGLTEAANETAKVGKVTGTLADALNWAGVNEDAFNASLAACNSEAEREQLIRSTLNGLYDDAAKAYEELNAATIAQNEAQSKLTATLASIGQAALPLVTALTNLANVILQALAPALTAIVPYLVQFVNMISKAVQWVVAFISAITGSSKAADTMKGMAANAAKLASGTKKTSDGFKAANKEAEKLKRTTQGFDELNILGSVSSGTAAADGGGGSIETGGTPIAGGGSFGENINAGLTMDTTQFEGSINRVLEILNTFKTNIQTFVQELAIMFEPAISGWVTTFQKLPESWAGIPEVVSTAWNGMLETMTAAWDAAAPSFIEGTNQFSLALSSVADYVLNTFMPTMITAFSENIAPVIADVFGFQLEEAAKMWEWLGTKVNEVFNDVLVPVLDFFKNILTDVFTIIKDKWDKYGKPIMDGLSEAFQDLRDKIDTFYTDCFKPIWDKIMEAADRIWQKYLKPLVDNVLDAIGSISADLLWIYNNVISPVLDWILDKIYPVVIWIAEQILKHIESAIEDISQVINGIITVATNLVAFIKNVFSGNWREAWNNIKNIFKGIWDSLSGIVKSPINVVIGLINSLISGFTTVINKVIGALNSFSIDVPDWVEDLTGIGTFGFDIPEVKAYQIPKLAEGGLVMSETLARIGEGGKKEAVLPLEQNTSWMDMLAERLAAKTGTPSKIVLVMDGKELGWASINSINSITKQTGSLQLSMV